MRLKLIFTLLSLCCLSALPASSQQADTVQAPDFVYLLNADEIRFEKYINPDAQRLIGNVVFLHDSMYMYCDSALFYQESNSFDAYYNVRIEQGDTLFMYGDSLFYDGTSKLLRVRDNVRLENTSMVLLTDNLNYDRNTGLGWFFKGGTLLDGESTLISQYGQFDTSTNLATFMDGVSFENPDYQLFSDTLSYNTDLHTAYLTCPTEIKTDDALVNSSRGYFNTDSGDAVLLDRSVITHKEDGAVITGDSILMARETGLMTGYGNVVINDVKDKLDAYGDYVFYDSNIDSAVVADKALVVEYSSGDSLFMHADTFALATRYNETGDTVLYRHVRAYHKVRAFRPDVQAVADSMLYTTVDSSLTLFSDPIIWNEGTQVLGEKIVIFMNDSTVDWVDIIGQALFVQQIDTVHYNQIAGREMKAWFKDGQIERTNVSGNVECVYYAQEADSTMIGMNTTVASNLTTYFKDGTVDRIYIQGRSNGVMYPMSQLEEKKMYLASFNWFDRIRPIDKEDVFYWRGKRQDEQLKHSAMGKPVPLPSLNKRNR